MFKRLFLFVLLLHAISLAFASLVTEKPESSHLASLNAWTPESVLESVSAVAAWHLQKMTHPTLWGDPVFPAGLMAVSYLPGGEAYDAILVQAGGEMRWDVPAMEGPSAYPSGAYNAGMTWIQLYFRHQQPEMIGALQRGLEERLDQTHSLPLAGHPDAFEAMFAAAPTWVSLYAATGYRRYLDAGNRSWRAAADALFVEGQGLFYNDTGGSKLSDAVFTARENGLALAGLVRLLEYFPEEHPDFLRYLHLYRKAAARIAGLQQPGGLWPVQLNGQGTVPGVTGGTGLLCYALSRGIQRGFIDRVKYLPVVAKAWEALLDCVEPGGRLVRAKPVDDSRDRLEDESASSRDAGAFLLAAAEVYSLVHPATQRPAEAHPELTGDGAWCWFSEPRAIGLRGKTYTGWVTKDGSIQGAEIRGPGEPAKIFTLHPQLQIDDHNNPAFLGLPGDRLAAFYCTHSADDLYMRITEKPGDTDHWTPIRKLGLGDRLCYVNPVRLEEENNRLFLFYRGSHRPTVTTSDDLGLTWSVPKTVIEPERSPKHSCYARYWDDGKGRINFLFTEDHPQYVERNRVYFMRYENGAFRRADGTPISTMETLPIPLHQADLVDDGTRGLCWIWDVAEDHAGRPVVVYTRIPGLTPETLGRDHRYVYAKWNGGQWTSHEIAKVGRWFPQTPEGTTEREPYYSPGISLDKTDPSLVYYSDRVDGRLEIFRAITADHGANWTAEQLTFVSDYDNVRPITVRNPNASSPAVLWMNFRRYVHWTDFDSFIRMVYPGIGRAHPASRMVGEHELQGMKAGGSQVPPAGGIVGE